jgi:hypothetical protein
MVEPKPTRGKVEDLEPGLEGKVEVPWWIEYPWADSIEEVWDELDDLDVDD